MGKSKKGTDKKGIDTILKNERTERVDDDKMKGIFGGRDKFKKLNKIIIGFRDIMPI